MPALRGHHLLCLFFFNGEGYTPEFINNLRDTIKRAEEGEIEIVRGADSICMQCPNLKDDRCCYENNAEEEIQAMDQKALDLLKVTPGKRVTLSALRERLPTIFPAWYKTYCRECDWLKVCERSGLFQELRRQRIYR